MKLGLTYYGSRLGDSLVLISTLLEQVISEDAGQDALYRVEAKGFAESGVSAKVPSSSLWALEAPMPGSG
jgi:hypothetical protein